MLRVPPAGGHRLAGQCSSAVWSYQTQSVRTSPPRTVTGLRLHSRLPLLSLIRSHPSSPSDTLKTSHSRAPLALRPYLTFRPLATAPGPRPRLSLAHQTVPSACHRETPRSLQPRDFTSAVTGPAPRNTVPATLTRTPAPPHPRVSAGLAPPPAAPASSKLQSPLTSRVGLFTAMPDVCSFFIVGPSPTRLSAAGLPEGTARVSPPSPAASTAPRTERAPRRCPWGD